MHHWQRAIIFANGDPTAFEHLDWPDLVAPNDWLIGADRGAAHFARFGVCPHLVIGDFDSLPDDALNALAAQGAEVRRFPTRKDETDLELALLAAVDAGIADIIVVGALSSTRWDMTLGNMLLPLHPAFRHVRIRLIDAWQQLLPMHAGPVYPVPGSVGATVSLIPLRDTARGVTTTGLEYPLTHGDLPYGTTLGLSNRKTSPHASVVISQGDLICIVNERVV